MKITKDDVGRLALMRNGELVEITGWDDHDRTYPVKTDYGWRASNGASFPNSYPSDGDIVEFYDGDDAGSDPVSHPRHYTEHPSGIECIQITEHMGFCLGNAVKYLWRADLKDDAIQDMQKAIWYIQREIERRNGDDC